MKSFSGKWRSSIQVFSRRGEERVMTLLFGEEDRSSRAEAEVVVDAQSPRGGSHG